MASAPFDLAAVARAICAGRLHWRLHLLQRMAERAISRGEVLAVLEGGEVIEEYGDDTPYPSALVLGSAGSGPLHVVVALDSDGPDAYLITAYRPAAEKFEPDGRTRRNP